MPCGRCSASPRRLKLLLFHDALTEDQPFSGDRPQCSRDFERTNQRRVIGFDFTDKIPEKPRVRWFDLIVNCAGMITFLFDLISDITMSVFYYRSGEFWACGLVLGFTIVPSFILNGLSFGWLLEDYRRTKQKNTCRLFLCVLACVLQVGPVVWYLDAILYGWRYKSEQSNIDTSGNSLVRSFQTLGSTNTSVSRSRSETYNKDSDRVRASSDGDFYWSAHSRLFSNGDFPIVKFPSIEESRPLPTERSVSAVDTGLQHAPTHAEHRQRSRALFLNVAEAERDATLLRLFEAFLEAAPQAMVQAYLFGYRLWKGPKYSIFYAILQSASLFFSVLSLSWSVVAQHRCLRFARLDKENMKWQSSLLQFIWRLTTISCRVSVIAMFTLAYQYWIGIFAMVHYCISLLYLVSFQPLDMGSNVCAEICVVLIAGFVHFFTPLNISEGSTRCRYAWTYSVEFCENVILAFLVYFAHEFLSFQVKRYILLGDLVLFCVGICAMLLYYKFFHPSRSRRLVSRL